MQNLKREKRKNKFRIKHKIIDDTYKKYNNIVNMSYIQLLSWSKNKCSKMASLSRNPIKRNTSSGKK